MYVIIDFDDAEAAEAARIYGVKLVAELPGDPCALPDDGGPDETLQMWRVGEPGEDRELVCWPRLAGGLLAAVA
jgi:hypothetical protein